MAVGAGTRHSACASPWNLCWAEARIQIARMTLTIKLDRNWSSLQLANSAPPLSGTDSAIAPSARMAIMTNIQMTKLNSSTLCWPCASRTRPLCYSFELCARITTMGYMVLAGKRMVHLFVGGSSKACHLLRNTAMDDSIGSS